MITKAFEVVDRATCLIVIATKVSPGNENEKFNYDKYEREHNLLRRAGFGDFKRNPLVLLYYVEGKKAYYSPFEWRNRTLKTAHQHIQDNFDELQNDDVIDVEYVLGEKDTIKNSEVV